MFSKSNEVEESGFRRITKKLLLELCKKDKLYQTPYINDVLYLHYQGFRDIEGLDEYTGLRSLWLECNAISEIRGLTKQSALRCLFLQHNLIRKIENLHTCPELDTVNLSHNQITNIENCGTNVLPVLTNLNLANNYIRYYDGLRGLLECKTLSSLDLSNNRIEDTLVVKIFSQMPELRVLILQGNPVVGNIPQYRKTFILECKNLTYLDSRPIFAKDRACAEAWKRGGYEEEKAERDRWIQEDHRKMYENVKSFIELKNFYKNKMEEKNKELSTDDESFKSITDTTSDVTSDSEVNSQTNDVDLENEAVIEKNTTHNSNDEPENLKLAKDKANTRKIEFNEEIQIIRNKYTSGRSKNKRRRRGCQRANRRKSSKIQNKGNWPRTYKLKEDPEAVLATAYMYHEIVDLNFDVNQNLIFSEENLNKKSEVYKKAYNAYLNNVSFDHELSENHQNDNSEILEKQDQHEDLNKIENENLPSNEAKQEVKLNIDLSETKKYQKLETIENNFIDSLSNVIENKIDSEHGENDKTANETVCANEILDVNVIDKSFVDSIISNEVDVSLAQIIVEKNEEMFNNITLSETKYIDIATDILLLEKENKMESKSKIENEIKILDDVNILKTTETITQLNDQTAHDNEFKNPLHMGIIDKDQTIYFDSKSVEKAVKELTEYPTEICSGYVCPTNTLIKNELSNQNMNPVSLKNIQIQSEDINQINGSLNENTNTVLANVSNEFSSTNKEILEINMTTETQINKGVFISAPETKLDLDEMDVINSEHTTKSEFINYDPVQYNNIQIDETITGNFHKNVGVQVDNFNSDNNSNMEKPNIENCLQTDENYVEEEMQNADNTNFSYLYVEGTSCLQKSTNT